MSVNTLINKSKNRIGNVHPVVWKYGQDLIRKAYGQGLYIMFSDGHRTHAEQNALYAQGRSKPGNIVTNARGGQSLHNYGIAFDMFITNKSGTSASWNTSKLNQAGRLAKTLGFEWGGDWTSIVDRPHIQMTGGLSLAQLQAGAKPNLTYKGGNTGGSSSTSNPTIKKLQQDLNKLGYKAGKADGINGKNTKSAVRSFQKDEGLKVDGIAGKDTKAEIKRILNGGLTMSEAKKINNRLNKIEASMKKKENKDLTGGKVSKTHEKNMEKAENMGLMSTDNPFSHVTREQLATVVVRVVERFIKSTAEIEDYAIDPFEWAEEHGISKGGRPAELASRQQVITFNKRTYDLIMKEIEKMLEEINEE